jgi:hypothetical protein
MSSSGGFRTPKSAAWSKGVTARAPVSGGSCKKTQCDNCETEFTGGTRRILEHHVKCKSAPVPLKDWAIDELTKMDSRHREKESVKDMEGMFDDIKEEATQTKLTGSTKDKIDAAKAVCDKAVADWVYVTMQSFQVTCDSSFIEMLQTINKFAPPGYAPPLPGLIRGTLLTAAYEKSKEEAKVMFKDNEHNCALTIMSDGKTNNGKVPICNFIAKSAKGAHFLAAVDMSLKDKSNKKMAEYIHEQCVATGVEKSFFLCVLDGALRSSFPFLEEKMPWITCIWCSCHILSLFFKDCFNTDSDKGLPALALCLKQVKTIVTFVRDRQKPLAFFNEISKKALILPGAVVVVLNFCTVSLFTVRR